jgi:RHS repeat-associated protein
MQRRYNPAAQSWYNYYYVQDGLGHTRLLLDGNGNAVNRYAYDAWGNLIEYEEAVPNPFTWNGAYGYEYIPLTGLYHVGAREYDPRTGRWLQRDPIEASSGDPHFWRYCGNDPLNGVDPSGLDAGWAERSVPNDPYGEKRWFRLDRGDRIIVPIDVDLKANIREAERRKKLFDSPNPCWPGLIPLHGDLGGPSKTSWFVRQVVPGGPWDYKTRDADYENFGNFNYGATGAALGFSQDDLLYAAGRVQQYTGPTDPSWGTPSGGPPYGDDPRDQDMIRQGYQYYRAHQFARKLLPPSVKGALR